jgi:demethylmenaquinone methyltransferase/2-methoxy-6-polyprenyl-1,4-benzoquinol methylase
VVVLEITTPTSGPLALFYGVWFDKIVPMLGRAAGAAAGLGARLGSSRREIADAYAYLPSSVKRFPSPPALAGEMQHAGLCEITYLLTAGGIVAIHAGTVPAKRAS